MSDELEPPSDDEEPDEDRADGVGSPEGDATDHHGHPTELGPVGGSWRRHRGRWTLVAAVVVAIALLGGLLGFGLTRDPTIIRSTLIGKPAPDFALDRLDGTGTVKLSSLRGQVVVVNFWASWCAGCKVEHPGLMAAWDRYRDAGVVFVGIPFEDREPASNAYLQQYGGDWPNVVDPRSQTAIRYGVYGLPETYVIAPDGTVVYKQVGPIPYTVLTNEITKAQQAVTR
jgi:cytochrome c biogenesis protein CcmG/thiol:disulfide interchange protein DsbE